MPDKTVVRWTTLKCVDCPREFEGWAELKEHYVESGTVNVGTSFGRALDPCPVSAFHRVGAVNERS